VRYRSFGGTGVVCSEIALGTSLFGSSGYGATTDDAREILNRYLDVGGNFIDTASRYRFGESEEALGQLIGARRDALILASKYSLADCPDPALTEVGASRKTMVQSVERSLKRLRTDRIDVLYVHMDDCVTPMGEILRGFEDLITSGKIIYGGLSNYPAWRVAYGASMAIERGWAPLSSVQIEYSVLQRTPEREILPMASALNLAVLCWSPLAGGLLTGKYRLGEIGRAQHYPEAMHKSDSGTSADAITAVIDIARECDASPGQVALAWLLARHTVPVIGPRTREQLLDNLAASELTLSGQQITRINAASEVSLGYPHELAASQKQRAVNTAGRAGHADLPHRPVA
jgi:aryl-alcohol dehydrogenase-like predicted oxidoreductase